MADPTSNNIEDYNIGDSYITSTDSSVNGKGIGAGAFHTKRYEQIPTRKTTPTEKVFSNDNNAWIVLGRDRPASIASGYGSKPINGTGCIDLCVGMMAGAKSGPKANTKVDPNFAADAARIYISQKTDIDENFGLAPGKKEKLREGSTKAKSGIGIKADGVRIIARENGIKLITGKGNFKDTGLGGEKNSRGERIVPNDFGSIELIAGNDTTEMALSELVSNPILQILNTFFPIKLPNKIKRLQPMVKGDNLVQCLKYIMNIIDSLNAKINILVDQFVKSLNVAPSFIAAAAAPNSAYASALAQFVNGLIAGRLTTEIALGTDPLAGSIKKQIDGVETNFLEPYSFFYINSKHCRLT